MPKQNEWPADHKKSGKVELEPPRNGGQQVFDEDLGEPL